VVAHDRPENPAGDDPGRAVWSRRAVKQIWNSRTENDPMKPHTNNALVLPKLFSGAWWIYPFLMAMALCAGCRPSDSALSKIARDREAKPIIEALAAYQRAKG
jgi:hypothetical protein